MTVVSFDRKKLDKFKDLYKTAVNAGAETMIFDGEEYHVGYAKYLIEYLNNML